MESNKSSSNNVVGSVKEDGGEDESKHQDFCNAKRKFSDSVRYQLSILMDTGKSRKQAVEMILRRIGMKQREQSPLAVNGKEVIEVMKRHSLSEEHARRALIVKTELQKARESGLDSLAAIELLTRRLAKSALLASPVRKRKRGGGEDQTGTTSPLSEVSESRQRKKVTSEADKEEYIKKMHHGAAHQEKRKTNRSTPATRTRSDRKRSLKESSKNVPSNVSKKKLRAHSKEDAEKFSTAKKCE